MLLHNFLNHNVARQITSSQHGFMKGRSTTTNLVCITQFIAESIDNHMQTDVIYTDFSKAFDRLDHSILLDKLNHFGLSDTLILLLSSLLHNRIHYVMYNGYKSAEYVATSGVPQGSVLGPLLFIIFINDIVDLLDSDCLLYADDLKIFGTIESIADCIRIQSDLEKLYNWCKNNKLPLNAAKCNAMSFTLKSSAITFDYHLGDVTLTRPTTFRDLGVIFDGKLSFTMHIETIISEAGKTYGFIARNGRDFSNAQTLKLLYFTFVRSKLEYASVVWCPHYTVHVHSIESVQRRFLKLLSFKLDNVYPCTGFPQDSLLDRHSVLSLDKRREYFSQVLLFKVVNNIIDCQEILAKLNFIVPRVTSRANLTFYLPTPRTNILKYSPIHVMCTIYNSLKTIDIFKDSLKDLKNVYMK